MALWQRFMRIEFLIEKNEVVLLFDNTTLIVFEECILSENEQMKM
jgi:hypothetical protein